MKLALPLILLTALGGTHWSSVSAEERASVVIIGTRNAKPYASALAEIQKELRTGAPLRVEFVDRAEAAAESRIQSLEPDLLITLGSRATSWARDNVQDVPIVFAMVLNPVSSGLVGSMRRPGGRITGASLDIPLRKQFRALKTLVHARKVGVLYNPELTGKIVSSARIAARAENLELVPIEVSTPKELDGALKRIDDSFDALWSVADRTVLSHGAVEQLLLHSLREKIPFMGLSEPYVRAGALFALSTSYVENGRKAARLAMRVLNGEKPAGLAIEVPEEIEVIYNKLTAERLTLRFNDSSEGMLRAVELR